MDICYEYPRTCFGAYQAEASDRYGIGRRAVQSALDQPADIEQLEGTRQHSLFTLHRYRQAVCMLTGLASAG